MQEVSEYACRFMTVATDHHVLEHAHAEENLQVLKRARQAAARELFRRKRGHVLAAQAHAAGSGQVKARDEVEQRGLAGAVRTDDREDETGCNRHAHVIDRTHAAEGDRQVFGNEDHARLKESALANVGTMPARKKIITSMTIRPSAICS